MVIDKCIPEARLLAQIIYDKFVTYLPLYRQSQRYEQLGMKLSRLAELPPLGKPANITPSLDVQKAALPNAYTLMG